MLKKMWIWALLLLIPVPVMSAENIAFVHANVLSMDRNEILRDSTVLIQGDRITDLGSFADVHLPDGCRVIDASGKYLMPGLIDAHVHMARKEELALFLLSGVTTVQGLGGYPPRSKGWLQEINRGNLTSPDYISCDTIAEQPYTADEVRTFVRKAASDGFTCIKLYSPPDWTQEAYAAFSDEAAKNKIRTVGHFPRNLDLKIAVKGLGSVAHAEEYLYTYFNKLPNRRDETTIPYAVQQTKEAGLGVIPNLVAYHLIGLQTGPDIAQLMNAPGMENILQIVRNTWAPEYNRYRKTFNAEASQRVLSNYAFLQKLVLQMQKAGIPLATGTDTSSYMPFVLPGLSEQAEIRELVSAGFTPYEALTTATSGAARVVGMPDQIGRIAKGMRANLLLLSANPLEDVANTSHIEGVMIRGDWLNHDKMEQLKQQYKSWKNKWDDWMNSVLQSHDEAGARKALERAQSYKLEIDEEALNNLAYSLLQNTSTVSQGVSILRFNTIAFPKSANAFDSLGDAYAKSGETQRAIQSYEESLRLNKDNTHAREVIEQLKNSGAAVHR